MASSTTRVGLRLLLLAVTLTPAACDRHRAGLSTQAAAAAIPEPAGGGAAAEDAAWLTAGRQEAAELRLAYTHNIAVQLPALALPARFAAARDRCLNPATRCILVAASIANEPDAGSPGVTQPHAGLQMRLPHEQVAPFAASLTRPLPGETAGTVRLLRQATRAADLTGPTRDLAQRIAQLSDYLASLKTMAARLTISVSDLVKIEGETAQAQTQIEQAQAEQRDLALRAGTEAMEIRFEPTSPPLAAEPDPVARTLRLAPAILQRSAAAALEMSIEAVPWVPLALAAMILLGAARLVLFGRRR